MKKCLVDGCPNTIGNNAKRVYCRKHQYHFQRYGDATYYAVNIVPKRCQVNGCAEWASDHGFCSKHGARFRRWGDPTKVTKGPRGFAKKHRQEYSSYTNMKSRCCNPNHTYYNNYGGRGIKICDRWLEKPNGFNNFMEDMGSSNGLTLDRIDPNGDYCPENCRWATRREQANNQRRKILFPFRGERLTISQWARKMGLSVGLVYNRIMIYKWPIERALLTPPQHRREK